MSASIKALCRFTTCSLHREKRKLFKWLENLLFFVSCSVKIHTSLQYYEYNNDLALYISIYVVYLVDACLKYLIREWIFFVIFFNFFDYIIILCASFFRNKYFCVLLYKSTDKLKMLLFKWKNAINEIKK